MDHDRVGGGAAVLAGVTAVVFNVLHAGPRRGSTRLFLEDLDGSRIWVADHLGIAVSLVLMAIALVAIGRRLDVPSRGPWGPLGTAVGLVGVALALANVAIDGPAMKEVAERWSAASGADRAAIFAAADVLRSVDIALFSTWILVLVGITPMLFGVAILAGGGLPRPLGWPALAAGPVAVAVAVIQYFEGLRPITVFVLFPAASGVLAVWLIATGVVMWRAAAR